MFYLLQNVMLFNFNIVQNIYELTCFVELRKNHYRRINDVKSRRRLNATHYDKLDSKTTTFRTINMTTIWISINDKISNQSFLEWIEVKMQINIESQTEEHLIKRLISIRLKKSLCTKKNASDVTSPIILKRIVKISNLKWLKWARISTTIWTREKNNFHRKRDENKRTHYSIFSHEE
jgi:hypothetical protein